MSRVCSICAAANNDSDRFCRACGNALTDPARSAPPPVAAARRAIGAWVAPTALVVVLAAAGIWWITASRTPTAARIAAPSTPAASVPAPVAAPPVASAPAVARAPASAASVPGASPWDTVGPDGIITESSDQQLQAAKDAAARRRVEPESRARPLPAMPPLPARSAASVPPPAARTVQESCANRNPIVQAICESRECARGEHANETICQRIRAADDRRREQN
jgi:hypothetical protein